MSIYTPPYPPYDPIDKTGFSYETVVKRWPVILTGIIDSVYGINHELSSDIPNASNPSEKAGLEEKYAEGKGLIEKVGKLKYEMGRDRALEPIEDDGETLVDEYNAELARLADDAKNTWFTAPWLYAECYLYRLIRSFFAQTKQWRTYDPFLAQKQSTFKASGTAIYQLATTMHDLEAEKDTLASDPDKLEVLFREMIQMCLWGNATASHLSRDLSLLTHMSPEDIRHLQTVGKDAQQARREFILKDDQTAVWDHIKSLKDARVDFVLDNAGFELYTDFLFADFLVTYTPYISRVVFHPKSIPWFVSDVTPPDFTSTPASLLSPTFFPSPSSTPSPAQAHLHALVTRWQRYLSDGTFALSVPHDTLLGQGGKAVEFWTSPWPYWDMEVRGKEVWEGLRESGLVVFKGDLNYRKLTGDVKWPVDTPFSLALGPLAYAFPLLSLRTNKADVVVGVPQDVADALDAKGEKWRVNGKYALVSFLPRVEEGSRA
ncbi:DUF89 domain-containing protein [Auriscalpium vulgare]|uniref:DUF89 domain-containing protein n=1 Tax=Auriscalpium vulgare TaxID=40419 RepID=A0ACB8S1P7_9AGAM|nr:DUF89 domain-containing protein [Auriscalpium vulgare]